MSAVETEPDLAPGIRLAFASTPANVALARQVVAGLADALDVDAARAADMKIAATEACTNVVVHAYPEGEGDAEVSFTTLPGHVVISVRDRGVGFQTQAPSGTAYRPDEPASSGYGLALIGTLSDEFAIMSGAAGTEVQMLFALGEQPPPETARIFAATSQMASGAEPPGRAPVALTLETGEPVRHVLGRLISMLAARAGFSIDRLSDAQLVSDALARHVPSRTVEHSMTLAAVEREDGFELTIGSLQPGAAQAIVTAAALPGVGSLLERLCDELGIDAADGVERLRLTLVRR